MPYASTKQRAYIHAKAAEGVAWAQKFIKDADKADQPKNEYSARTLAERLKKHRKRRKHRRKRG